MRSPFLYTASILALLAGPAFAQTADTPPPVAGDTGMTQDMGAAPGTEPTTPPGTDAAMGQPPGAQPSAVSIENMIGRTVRGSDGESLGSVEDVIMDPQSGEARQLVISSGGFLGIGAKQIAVDIADAQVDQEQDIIVMPNLTQADVETMPEFEMEEGTATFKQPGETGMTNQ